MNALGKPHGSVGMSVTRGITSPAYWVLRSSTQTDPRFLHHLLRSRHLVNEYQRLGKNQPPNQFDLSWSDFQSLQLPIPMIGAQRRIADFLDDQVARIDNIIAARRVQADQAEVLRRWTIVAVLQEGHGQPVPLNYAAVVDHGRQRSPADADGPFMTRYVRSANVSDGRIDGDLYEMNFDPPERARYGLRDGDVLVTEASGSADAIGASAMWTGSGRGTVCFQNHLVRLRPRTGWAADYLEWWARAAFYSGAMKVWATGANILNLGSDSLRRMPIIARSLSQQASTAAQCAQGSDDADRGKAALKSFADRMHELKQSLITSAVTGEFDVSSADGSQVVA